MRCSRAQRPRSSCGSSWLRPGFQWCADRHRCGPPPSTFDALVADSFSIEFWVNTGALSLLATVVVIGRFDGAVMGLWVGASQTNGRAVFYLRDTIRRCKPTSWTSWMEVGFRRSYRQLLTDTGITLWPCEMVTTDTTSIYVDGVLQESVSCRCLYGRFRLGLRR